MIERRTINQTARCGGAGLTMRVCRASAERDARAAPAQVNEFSPFNL